MDQHHIPVKEISELLDLASEQLPALITNLLQTLYSPEAGQRIGKAVGALYKELIQSGIPAELAAKMASDYMISLKDVVSMGTETTHKK